MRSFSPLALTGAALFAFSAASSALAQVTYQLDSWPPPNNDSWEIFNNSQGTETEDCWVANSFQVVAGGEHITTISFRTGVALTNQPVTAVIYTGGSLTSPAGLVRVVPTTTATTITAAVNTPATITLVNPVDLPVGQVFYAAVLLPAIPGTIYPYTTDFDRILGTSSPLNRSFFDVGATQGAAYNLDATGNATVLGGIHPVVAMAQDPANLVLTVGASAVQNGACCRGSTCGVGAIAACTGTGVLFAGVGTACSASPLVTTPCCRADFNQSGGLSVQDIFDFLTAWFAGDSRADINGGGLSVQDIFDFLTAWFNGC